jgi:hypothetical protein
MSAPRLNNAMPRIRKIAETEKATVSVVEKLTRGVQFKIKTINATGKTETQDSLNFVNKAFSMRAPKSIIFAKKFLFLIRVRRVYSIISRAKKKIQRFMMIFLCIYRINCEKTSLQTLDIIKRLMLL